MNRIYKTVWNAVRGQLVVVNEATTSHSQADASTKTGSVVSQSAPVQTFAKTALAAVVAGMLVNPAFAADKTLQWEVDQSAGISAADNVTITETGGITLNKTYTDDGFSQTNENTKFTARKTLTNSGYVRGDAKLEAAKIVNNAQGEIEMGTVEILSPTATEVITNAGTFSADTLTTGVGNVTNTGKMTVKNAYDLQGKLTNNGTQLKLGTANVTGELANSAKTGATVDVLNVQGTGRVTGTGTLTATGAVDIATGASLAQGEFDAVAKVTNKGTVNVTTMKQTAATGEFVNKKSATFTDFDGVGTITNEATGTMTVNGTLNVKKTAANAGTLNATGTLNASGTLTNTGTMSVGTLEATGTVTNSKTATITTALNENGSVVNEAAGTITAANGAINVKKSLQNKGSIEAKDVTITSGVLANSGSKLKATNLNVNGGKLTNTATTGAEAGVLNVTQGSIDGAGSMKVTGKTTVAQGASVAQANLDVQELDVDGTMNVTTKLTGNGTAAFKAHASGTVASADMKADMTHQGSMTFNALNSASKIANNAGTLTVKTLTGTAAVTNAQGATLDMTGGNAAAATLVGNGTTKLNTANITTKITNAGQMTSTGKVQTAAFDQTAQKSALHSLDVTGLVNVTGGELAATETLTAQTMQNAATVNTKDLTVKGSLNNSKTLTSTGIADVTNFTQTAAGTANLQAATLKGTGSIAGTVTAKGDLTFADASTYTGEGAITAQQALNVNGNVTMTNKVTAKGATTVATGKTLTAKGLDLQQANVVGTLSNQGAAGTIADLNMTRGAKLLNNDVLTIATMSNADGVTYTQTGNAASIKSTDGTWFSNSTINLEGGVMNRSAEGLGMGNTYNVKASGASQIPGGDLNNDDWKNGMSILTVGSLTRDNLVNLEAGGLLEVGKINLDQGSKDGKTLTLNGGAIETTLDQMFEGLKVEALNYETVDGNGKIEVSGASVLGVSKVGELQQEIKDHTTLTGGDIIFKDSINVDQVTKISQALNDVSSGNVTVHFTGKTDKVFTVDVANSLITANDPTKIVFDSSTLYARDPATGATGKTLYVGGQDSDGVRIDGTIGFSNIVETEKVVIQDGKGLALVGKADQSHSSLVGDNGSVDVKGAGSELVLGTTYRESLTGKLNAVTLTEGGKLLAKGGDYQVATITATGAAVETVGGSKLSTDALTVTGAGSRLTNQGAIVAKSFTDDAEAASTNKGTLQVTKATTVAGNMTNQTGGSLTIDGRLTVTGKLINEAAQVTRAGSTGIQVAGIDVVTTGTVKNAGVLVSTGTNNFTSQFENVGLNSQTHVFHNEAGATVDLSKGATVIGGATTANASHVRAKAPETSVLNEGTMKLADVTVNDFGTLHNGDTGQITAGTITVDTFGAVNNAGELQATSVNGDGVYRNSKTTIANTVALNKLTNEGDASQGEGFKVIDSLSLVSGLDNKTDALIDARTADVMLGDGSQSRNAGIFLARTLSLGEGASLVNEGEQVIEDLTLGEGDEGVTNKKGSSAVHNKLTMTGSKYVTEAGASVEIQDVLDVQGGVFENRGKASVLKSVKISGEGEVHQLGEAGSFTVAESLDMTGGKFIMTSGSLAVTKGVDFKGGVIDFLGQQVNDDQQAEKKQVAASLMLKGDIEGALNIDTAKVTVGKWTDAAAASARTSEALPSANSILIADTAPLKIGTNGKLAVGSGARAKAETMTAGSAWFGGDSLFVLDTSKMTTIEEGGSAALVGNTKGDLTVDAGAKLHVGALGWGDYYVTKDFAKETVEGWQSVSPADPAVKFEVKQDKDGNVILTVGSGDIHDKLPEVGTGGIVNDIITNPDLRDPNRKDVIGFISKAVEDGIIAAENQAEVINSVTQIGAAGGLMNQNFTLVGNVMDQVDRHMSYEDVHFKKGEAQAWDGVRLWANALGQKVEVSGADYTGGSAAFDGENIGFIMGANLMAQNGVRYGAAFGYQKGDMDSVDSLVSTSNEADAFSITGYAAQQFGQFNLIGSLGYTRVDADLEQTLPSAMDMGKHTMNAKSDIITAGLKGEMHFKLSDNVAAVPYVGLRAVTVLSSDDTSTMGGKDAFHYDNDTLVQFQMPVGIAFEGMNTTASGWTSRGVFDISVTPVFGDKEADTTVTVNGIKSADKVSSDFADSVTGAVRMGVSAEKDNFSFGGELGVSVGDMRDSAVTFGLGARYRF